MSTFSVGFSRPKKTNLFSSTIMKFMGTNYSHTYLVFDVPATGQLVVCQANREGVHILEYSKFKEKNHVVDEINVKPENRSSALKFCISNLGQSYSFLTIISILFNVRFGDGKKQFICSELVARALKIDVPHLDMITPREIREYLEARNGN